MIPYIWSKYEFLQDSCGHGEWRGGLGTHVEAKNIYNREVWQPSTAWSCPATRTGRSSPPSDFSAAQAERDQTGDRARRGAQALPYHGYNLH